MGKLIAPRRLVAARNVLIHPVFVDSLLVLDSLNNY
jgi:hypothetical protein